LDDLLLKYSAAPKPVLISACLQQLNHRTMIALHKGLPGSD
jgi:hypothetical protein